MFRTRTVYFNIIVYITVVLCFFILLVWPNTLSGSILCWTFMILVESTYVVCNASNISVIEFILKHCLFNEKNHTKKCSNFWSIASWSELIKLRIKITNVIHRLYASTPFWLINWIWYFQIFRKNLIKINFWIFYHLFFLSHNLVFLRWYIYIKEKRWISIQIN